MSFAHRARPHAVRALHWAGTAVTLAAAGYVIYALLTTRGLHMVDWRSAATWGTVILAACAYAAIQLPVIAAWWLLLNGMTERRIPFGAAFRIYAISQLYKYLPLNVFHYVGRYAMLRAYAVGPGIVVWTAALEAALMILAAAGLAALLGWPLLMRGLALVGPSQWTAPSVWLAAATALLAGGAGLAALVVLGRRGGLKASLLRSLPLRAMLAALACYGLFFALTGAVAASLLGLLQTAEAGVPAAQVIAVVAAAWVIGFVMPGASAGIGVREAAIMTMLAPLASLEVGLALGICYRVVTVGGDGLLGLAGHFVRWLRPPPRP